MTSVQERRRAGRLRWKPAALALFWAITQLAATAGGVEYSATPGNYASRLAKLKPGDTLHLAAGTYPRMTIRGLRGTSSAWIVIAGPTSGAPAVITGAICCNTIEILNSSFVSIENVTIDSKDLEGVFGISAKDGRSNLTHDIRIQNNRFVGQGASQMTVAISTKTPTWGWIIRGNRISGAGTGIYLGNSDGTEPFVAGLIENNRIEDTIGYNMEIKWQRPRPMVEGMPTDPRSTIIRNNVFVHIAEPGVPSPRGKMIRAEPNLLVGGFPDAGVGSTDLYEVYENLFVGNLHESLLQASGRVTVHDNIFVGGDETAIAMQDHDLPLKLAHIYNNTIYSQKEGIRFGSPAREEDVVLGNLIFAEVPISGPVQHASGNITDIVAHAAAYVDTPAFQGPMDFHPLEGKCQGAPLNLRRFAGETDYALDFNGTEKARGERGIVFRGAYAGAGTNPGGKLQLTPKEPGPRAQAAEAVAEPAGKKLANPQVADAVAPATRPSLRIQPSTAKRGESGSFLILLECPEGVDITGMQWELSSDSGVAIDAADIVAGSAAATAEKNVSCSPLPRTPGERCVLVGGQKKMGNGPIAIVRYRISRQVHAGTLTVRLEKALAVARDLQTIDLGKASGVLTIR